MKVTVYVVFRRGESGPRVVEYYDNMGSASLGQWVWSKGAQKQYGIAMARVPLFQYFRQNLGQRIMDNWDKWVEVHTEGSAP